MRDPYLLMANIITYCAEHPELLSKKYRTKSLAYVGVNHDSPLKGHCYIASEAFYYLMGGKNAGWVAEWVVVPLLHDGQEAYGTHWYLRDSESRIWDITADQFTVRVPYEQGRACGFLTKLPSKRALKIMEGVS